MKKRLLSMYVAICMLVTGLFSVNAEQLQTSVKSQDLSKSASDVTYEDVLAGIASPYDYLENLMKIQFRTPSGLKQQKNVYI